MFDICNFEPSSFILEFLNKKDIDISICLDQMSFHQLSMLIFFLFQELRDTNELIQSLIDN